MSLNEKLVQELKEILSKYSFCYKKDNCFETDRCRNCILNTDVFENGSGSYNDSLCDLLEIVKEELNKL